MAQAYSRPPVTEAVIELRYGSSVSMGDVERVVAKVKGRYPKSDDLQEIKVEFRIGSDPIRQSNALTGKKLLGQDPADIFQVSVGALTWSRLAPYQGWESFIERFKSDFNHAAKVFEFRHLTRVGVRFINRLDIPLNENQNISIGEYLKVGVIIPTVFDSEIVNYSVSAQLPMPSKSLTTTLNVFPALGELFDHGAAVIDLDVARDVDLPRNQHDLMDLLTTIRDVKDQIFESCITDKARALIR